MLKFSAVAFALLVVSHATENAYAQNMGGGMGMGMGAGGMGMGAGGMGGMGAGGMGGGSGTSTGGTTSTVRSLRFPPAPGMSATSGQQTNFQQMNSRFFPSSNMNASGSGARTATGGNRGGVGGGAGGGQNRGGAGAGGTTAARGTTGGAGANRGAATTSRAAATSNRTQNAAQGGTNQSSSGRPSGPARRQSLQAQHRVAFNYAPARTNSVSESVGTRLGQVSTRVNLKNINTEAIDGKVTIRGEALSEDARKVAEHMARLEPGVRSVDNQLTVKPSASSTVPVGK